MGKKQSYSEDLLTDAVIRYAEVFAGKIEYTKLAAWASVNIDGLQGVRGYHFSRSIVEKDPLTGKRRSRKKVCTERVEDYNKARSLTANISSNAILRSSNPDKFFELSRTAQRETILETKTLFNQIERRNADLLRENDQLNSINKAFEEKNKTIDETIKKLEKKIKHLERSVNYVVKSTDQENKRRILEEMGLSNGTVDGERYLESLHVDLDNVFHIEKSIAAFFENNSLDHDDMMELTDLKKTMLEIFPDE